MAPGGGGEVHFSCPVRRTIKPVQLTDPGKIKRIRGTAYPSQSLCADVYSRIRREVLHNMKRMLDSGSVGTNYDSALL